jgi:site-specific DNA-methyltransferase (adenine-specific)
VIELNKIYNENCLGENGLKQISDSFIDIVLSDIPYGINYGDWDMICNNTNSALNSK